MGVMLQMVTAVGHSLCENRVGAEPLAERHVQFGAVRQSTVCAVVHQDRKSELTRADNRNRQNKGKLVGPHRDHRDRAEDQGPCMGDQRNTLPGRPRPHLDKLLLGHQVAGANAKGGHCCFSLPAGELPKELPRALPRALLRDEFPGPTTLSRTDGGGASACWPISRSISAARSSGARPIACPSSVTPIAIAQNRRALVSGSSRERQPRAAISAA